MPRSIPVLMALLLFACGEEPPPSVDGILLVTIDTCRPDRIGCYGSVDALTPALDRLAGEGVLFANCVAQVPTTLASHTTILSSLYPSSHRVPRNGFGVPPDVRTVAQILGERGFRTGAFVAAFSLHRTFGLDRGFDVYDDITDESPEGGQLERRASTVTGYAIEWLRDVGDRPFFLWVHYFDPHWPYDPPRPYGSIRRVPGGIYSTSSLEDLRRIRSGLGPFRPEDREAFFAAYDGEIAFADRWLERLLEAVPGPRRSRLLLLVAGDHGEGMGEHSYFFDHGEYLWGSGVDVPMILHAPALVQEPRIEEAPVRLLDVAPTLLEAAGVPAPADFEGESLLPAARGPIAPRVAFSEASKPWSIEPKMEYQNKYKAKSVRDERWKFVATPYRDKKELYDLWEDPGELRNVAGVETERAAEMEQTLLSWIRERDPGFQRGDLTIEAEIREKLRALGYY
ncbi:MAG: sulfatase [Candidatus Eisenbacteria bacterium]